MGGLLTALSTGGRTLFEDKDFIGSKMTTSTRGKIQNQDGYWDDEVKLVSHDSICRWAQENSLEIARAIYPHRFGPSWFPEDVDSTHAWASEHERDRFKVDSERLRSRPRPWPKTKVQWQVPIYGGDKRQLGFADLTIEVLLPRITAEWAT